ncbi:MAG TPA: response regulator transcription factor, partial [Flavobacteriales bacterium]|nr:response regulator transcription factor [Flavobacteriales bacterium]
MINSSPATLLLVDDQTMLLDGMEALVATMPMVQVVGRSNSGQEAIEKAILLKPDLVLMDVNMPGMDGIEATKRLLKVSPESRVLVLSMYGHKEFVLEVIEAGAYGYMLKNAGKAELVTALTDIINGRKYITPELDALIKQGD